LTKTVVCDIEADSLTPTKIHLIVCKDVDTGEVTKFLNPSKYPEKFKEYDKDVETYIMHNGLGYDCDAIELLCDIRTHERTLDTLILSRLYHYKQQGGHSLESWGDRFRFPKGDFNDFSKLTQEMVDYCVQDVELTLKVYLHLKEKVLDLPEFEQAVKIEHLTQIFCENMTKHGFKFNLLNAQKDYVDICYEIDQLDLELPKAFPSRTKCVKVHTPKYTKHGTISRTGFKWYDKADFSIFSAPKSDKDAVGGVPTGTYSLLEWVPFNPRSPKQVVERLNEYGWKPYDKTKGHLDAERIRPRNKREAAFRRERLEYYEVYGWKVNEENLSTLPSVEKERLWLDECRIKISKDNESTIENTIDVTQIRKELEPDNTTGRTETSIKINNCDDGTTSLLKSTMKWLGPSKDVAKFVENQKNLWSIIVTPQEMYVDCSATNATQDWNGLRDIKKLQKVISQSDCAKLLTRWLLLASRQSKLEEWFGLYNEHTGCIHGRFTGLGTWTHRMAHSQPNMGNIPRVSSEYGEQFRAYWEVERGEYLVGVDASGIQLRILAHYINDEEFTKAVCEGREEDGTDIHTVNMRKLGAVCASRNMAKTFIYAWLLGAGTAKIASIFGCTNAEAKHACDQFVESYAGLSHVKSVLIPRDAERGYFVGLDGRRVACDSEHLMLAGYLQNGESCVMKMATIKWMEDLDGEGIDYTLRNLVHDEWQCSVRGNTNDAELAGQAMVSSLRTVGRMLELNCPLDGGCKIGTNWMETH